MTYPKVINWIYKQDKKSEHIEVYYAEDEKEFYEDITEEKLHTWALAEAMSDF